MTSGSNNSRDERGVAMLYAAVFLLSAVWLVSLALDMGKLMATKTELQRAADAAALAGASAVDYQTGQLVEAVARDRAARTAASNEALREAAEPVVIDPAQDVDFPGTGNRVRVRVHRSEATGNPMTTIFARTLGITSLDVGATATAEVAPINPCEAVPPFGIPYVPGGFPPGTEYVFNLEPNLGGSMPSLSVGPPVQSLDMVIIDFSLGGQNCNQGPCAGIGGNSLGCYIVNGYGCCLKKGDDFPTIPLRSQFSTVQNSLLTRWKDDTDTREGIGYAEYAGNGNRVMVVPIVEVTGGGGGDGEYGDGDADDIAYRAKIVGFTAVFLTQRPRASQLIVGQVINAVAPGDPADTSTENKLYGTRLVLQEQ